MSTETDKDKLIASDEAFIHALYQELEDERQNSAESEDGEQPSKALDDKIIAAAHKAVKTTAKVSVLHKKQEKVKKSPRWQLPFSLAASTILVMILFVNQGERAIVPQAELMPAPELIKAQQQEGASYTSEALGKASYDNKLKAKRAAEQPSRNVEYRPLARNAAPTVAEISKLESRAVNKSFSEKKEQVVGIASDATMAASSPLVGDLVAELVANDDDKLPQALWLSVQQFQHYKQQSAHWFLIKEEQEYYLINVEDSQDKWLSYRLAKSQFSVTEPISSIKAQLTFKQINLLAK